MNIQEMHYDFKMKLNKIDSNKYRNMKIPEVDWKLNEAQHLYIALVAEPRIRNYLGFETSQRTIDDIASIVINNKALTSLPASDDFVVFSLPDDYLYFISTAELFATKEDCKNVKIETTVIQHDDEAERQAFYKPSFEWRETNIRFFNNGIKVFTNNEFTIDSLSINYIRKPLYMHYAEGFLAGGYKLPGHTTPLTGSQNCELPEHTHREIVDLAVALTTGDLELPAAYQFKMSKLKLNQLITN